MGTNVAYSPAQLGQEPGPELDWADENDLSPEELAQLHHRSQRVKNPSAFEQQCQQWLDDVNLLSEQEFAKRYF